MLSNTHAMVLPVAVLRLTRLLYLWPQVQAANATSVSTNDILKNTFGVGPGTSGTSSSGVSDAQAASDDATTVPRQVP